VVYLGAHERETLQLGTALGVLGRAAAGEFANGAEARLAVLEAHLTSGAVRSAVHHMAFYGSSRPRSRAQRAADNLLFAVYLATSGLTPFIAPGAGEEDALRRGLAAATAAEADLWRQVAKSAGLEPSAIEVIAGFAPGWPDDTAEGWEELVAVSRRLVKPQAAPPHA
jgi:hypothetical protein